MIPVEKNDWTLAGDQEYSVTKLNQLWHDECKSPKAAYRMRESLTERRFQVEISYEIQDIIWSSVCCEEGEDGQKQIPEEEEPLESKSLPIHHEPFANHNGWEIEDDRHQWHIRICLQPSYILIESISHLDAERRRKIINVTSDADKRISLTCATETVLDRVRWTLWKRRKIGAIGAMDWVSFHDTLATGKFPNILVQESVEWECLWGCYLVKIVHHWKACTWWWFSSWSISFSQDIWVQCGHSVSITMIYSTES